MTIDNYAIRPYILLEMSFIQKSYPDILKLVSSLVGDYLIEIGKINILSSFGLESFSMNVQSLERTFIDKVFAICDYFLKGEKLRHSRHIYDIYKISKMIDWKNQKQLICKVKAERKQNKTCLSAQDGVSISSILNKIVNENYYKNDYMEITQALLIKKEPYDNVIRLIKEIADSEIFDQ